LVFVTQQAGKWQPEKTAPPHAGVRPDAAKFFYQMRRYLLYTSRRSLFGFLASIQKAPEFQKIVYTEGRSTRGDASESVLRQQIRHVAQKGLQLAGLIVVEDSILAPVEFTCHQLVFGSTERMKGMGYAEPALFRSNTTCIR
jgi:hypothetical protein